MDLGFWGKATIGGAGVLALLGLASVLTGPPRPHFSPNLTLASWAGTNTQFTAPPGFCFEQLSLGAITFQSCDTLSVIVQVQPATGADWGMLYAASNIDTYSSWKATRARLEELLQRSFPTVLDATADLSWVIEKIDPHMPSLSYVEGIPLGKILGTEAFSAIAVGTDFGSPRRLHLDGIQAVSGTLIRTRTTFEGSHFPTLEEIEKAKNLARLAARSIRMKMPNVGQTMENFCPQPPVIGLAPESEIGTPLSGYTWQICNDGVARITYSAHKSRLWDERLSMNTDPLKPVLLQALENQEPLEKRLGRELSLRAIWAGQTPPNSPSWGPAALYCAPGRGITLHHRQGVEIRACLGVEGTPAVMVERDFQEGTLSSIALTEQQALENLQRFQTLIPQPLL